MAENRLGKRERFRIGINSALSKWCEEPFAWGGSDCLLALADIVAPVLGYDPAEEFRGRYSTARGALRVSKRYGGFPGALAAMARRHKWRRIAPDEALTGDIGICGKSGVIRYGRFWIARNPGFGYTSPASRLIEKAWRVK